MSDPIDAILSDTLSIIILLLAVVFSIGVITWVFNTRWDDDRYKEKYSWKSRRRAMVPMYRKPYKPKIPQPKSRRVRFDPKLIYMGPEGDYLKYRDIDTGKYIYKIRKTGEMKTKREGVMI